MGRIEKKVEKTVVQDFCDDCGECGDLLWACDGCKKDFCTAHKQHALWAYDSGRGDYDEPDYRFCDDCGGAEKKSAWVDACDDLTCAVHDLEEDFAGRMKKLLFGAKGGPDANP